MAKNEIFDAQRLNEANPMEVARAIGEYRRQNISFTILKKWIAECGEKMNIDESKEVLDVPDGWLIDTWGYVARMYNLGLIQSPTNLERLNKAITDLIVKSKEVKAEQKSKPSPMEIVKQQVQDFCDTIKPIMDREQFDIVVAVQNAGLSNTHIRQVINKLDDSKHKEQLEEYVNKESSKPKRKPKKTKVKSKEEICKLFKCMDEFEGIKGYKPEDIIGAKCIVVYHTQKNTITFYFGEKLGVHRSMITGFDENESGEYKLKDGVHLNMKGKIQVNTIYTQNYKGEEHSLPTGRVSNKMILVGKY